MISFDISDIFCNVLNQNRLIIYEPFLYPNETFLQIKIVKIGVNQFQVSSPRYDPGRRMNFWKTNTNLWERTRQNKFVHLQTKLNRAYFKNWHCYCYAIAVRTCCLHICTTCASGNSSGGLSPNFVTSFSKQPRASRAELMRSTRLKWSLE